MWVANSVSQVSRIAGRANRWLDGDESERRVRIAVSMFAVLMMLRIGLTRFTPMARIPAPLFDPPWYLSLLHRPPSVAVILTLQVVGGACAAAAVVIRRPRVVFAIAWVSYLLLAGLRASRGKIIHPDVLPLLAMVPMLFCPSDARLRGERVSGRFGAPIRASMSVVAIAYFFTGYQKLVASGLSWVLSNNMRWVLTNGVRASGVAAPELGSWIANHAIVAQGFAAATLVVEFGAVAALHWRRVRLPFAVAATLLHTGIWLFLNLDYSLWAATVWIVMIDWGAATVPKNTRSRVSKLS